MDDVLEQGKAAGLAVEMGAAKTLDMNRLARAYVKIRDARAEANRKAKEADDDFAAKLALIGTAVLDFLNRSNQQSGKTESGTFYKVLDIKPSASDWEAFYAWVKENDAFDFLEKRLKKSEIAAYMERNEGSAPPGVSVLREFVVRLTTQGTKKDIES